MNRKGMTLVELIIIMVIVGIGATLLAPNIGAWLPTYRLKSATRDVVSAMRVAQLKAISTNTTYRISFDLGAGSFIVQYRDSGGNFVNDELTGTLPGGVQIKATTFGGGIVDFNANSTATDGNISLRNTKGTEKTIRLSGLTGRVRVE